MPIYSGRKRPIPGSAWWLGDVKGVVFHQGLPYVPEIIWTELFRHHDKGTSALRRLENLLPGNAMKICSCYRCLPRTGKNYQLKGHESRLGRDCLCPGKATSYNSILFIVGLHNKPVQIFIDAPRLPDSIDWDSFLTSKSWSPRYHFRAQLRLPPTRLLQRWYRPSSQIQLRISWLYAEMHAERTFCSGLT